MSRYEGADEYIKETTNNRRRPEEKRDSRDRGEKREDRVKREDRDRRDKRSDRDRKDERDRAGSRSRARSPAPKGHLSDRLLAISEEERPNKPPGAWLTENMKKYKEENGIESDEEPTEEDIKNQVKLPSHDQVVNQNFKDPICTCKPSQEPRMQQDVQNQTANPGFQSMVCITIAMEDKPTTVDTKLWNLQEQKRREEEHTRSIGPCGRPGP